MSIYTLEDIEKIYLSYGLKAYETFGKHILDEVKNIDYTITDKNYKKYEDHSNEQVVTIDGEHTRDIDDAILVKKSGKFYSLTVYIADVSHYVKIGSKLDEEALMRGTSIYLPNKTLNMLPAKISNDICSLKESKKRLTLAVNMTFNNKGKLKSSRIFRAIICSKKKMTYEKVFKVLQKSDENVLNEYNEFIEQIHLMKDLAILLRKRRKKKGFLELYIPEYNFYIPSSLEFEHITISPYSTNIANSIIEEFMLITNMVVDKTFCKLGIPFIHRIHPAPSLDNIDFLTNKDYFKLFNKNDSYVIKYLTKKLKRCDENTKILYSYNIMRNLCSAKYSDIPYGHFALNFKYYCHFTSPIRRYSDLMIHRIISEYLDNGNVTKDMITKYGNIMADISKKCSDTESFAKKISREMENMYIAYYMQDFIGEKFKASIYHISKNNISIFIKDLMFIGKIKCSSIFEDDSIEPIFYKDKVILNNKILYNLYDDLTVTLVDIDRSSSKLIFEIS